MLSFQVNQLSWHHMTAKQCIAHIHKMFMSTQTLSREEGRPHIQVEDRLLRKLSVAAEDMELPTVPQATAQNIWEKAERLLNDPESISRAPGNDCAHMVVSQTSKKPHFVHVPVERLCVMNSALCGEDVNCAHTQLQLRRKHKLCHSFCIGFGNQSKNAISLNWSQLPKRKGLLEPKQESRLEKVVHSAKTHPLQLTGAVLMTFAGCH